MNALNLEIVNAHSEYQVFHSQTGKYVFKTDYDIQTSQPYTTSSCDKQRGGFFVSMNKILRKNALFREKVVSLPPKNCKNGKIMPEISRFFGIIIAMFGLPIDPLK